MASGLEIFEAESKLLSSSFNYESIIAKSQADAIVPQTEASQHLPNIGDISRKKSEQDEAIPKLAASSSSEDFDKAIPLNEIAFDLCPQCAPETCASDSNWIESLNAQCNTDFACANVSSVDMLAFMKKEEPAVSTKCL